MSTSTIAGQQLFGLLELDEAGTVLYCRIEEDGGGPRGMPGDITGSNFFTEVAPFDNAEELHHQFDDFKRSFSPADSFQFTCRYGDERVPVKILLARVSGRSAEERMKSVLVHIRKI